MAKNAPDPPRPPRPSRPDADAPPRRPRPSRPDAAPSPEDLVEVERALSILSGRHPDQVRAEREMLEAARTRRLAQEAVAREARAYQVRRLLPWIVTATVLVLVAGGGGLWVHQAGARTHALDALLEPLSAVYVAKGFHVDPRSTFAARDHLDADVEAGKCLVAFAARVGGDDRLDVDRGVVLHGRGTIAWCTCQPEHVSVTALAPGREGGVGLAQIEARLVGGALALPFLDPRPDTLASAGECAAEPLDAWLASQSSTQPSVKQWAHTDPVASKLLSQRHGDTGAAPTVLELVAGADPPLPFAIVTRGSPVCAIALSDSPDDLLTLRFPGDVRQLARTKGPVAWCDPRGATVTVWREGKGRLAVLAGPPDRVGGMLGLREMAARAGLLELATWVADADLGWSASSALRADGIAAADIKVSADPVPHARFVATSAGKLTPDARDGLSFACAKPPGADVNGGVCAQVTPLAWRALGGVGEGGIAAGGLPFWMRVFEPVSSHEVLQPELALLALARRLAAEGLEPTVEGVAEVGSGVDVIGRSGDVAIVAVGLIGEPPWVLPYTDLSVGWTLEGEPRFVAITPGAHVDLASLPPAHVPPEKRDAVVFRKATVASK